MKKHSPQHIQSRSWEALEQWCLGLIEHNPALDPLLHLIRHIRATPLRGRLFAGTSLNKLILGIYEDLEWDREVLHIEFDPANREWHFRYYPKPFAPLEFERTYTEHQGIEKLDQFIEYIKW